MSMDKFPLGFQERIIFSLRGLYDRYGYRQYRMSKFEEYDLYAKNKDFLISDEVITFTDRSGKLLALKPDVTLSIVKNTVDQPDTTQKLFYNENVYRVAKGSRSFRELMQVGLEALGNVDDYCVAEVLELACRSLRSISACCVLEISHLGLLQELIEGIGIPEKQKHQALRCIGQKNMHELTALCRSWGIGEENIEILIRAIRTCGAPEQVLPELKALLAGIVNTSMIDRLLAITDILPCPEMLRFDFSVVDDVHYYNGLVFKGFIQGLPTSVLSGGQYDALMKKMGRKSRAIGFAVYLDALERLDNEMPAWDVDVLLLCAPGTPLKTIQSRAGQLRAEGRSVLVQHNLPEGLRCREIIELKGNEV